MSPGQTGESVPQLGKVIIIIFMIDFSSIFLVKPFSSGLIVHQAQVEARVFREQPGNNIVLSILQSSRIY